MLQLGIMIVFHGVERIAKVSRLDTALPPCCAVMAFATCEQVWRSILSEQPSFSGSSWKEISDPAKDFCRTLLNK
jgi:hypothetical protein